MRRIKWMAFAFLGVSCSFFLQAWFKPSIAQKPSNTEVKRYLILIKEGGEIPKNLKNLVENAGGEVVRELPEVGIAIAVSSNTDFSSEIEGNVQVQSVAEVPVQALPQVVISEEVKSLNAPISTTSPLERLNAPTVADDLYNLGLLWGINRVNAPAAWLAGVTGSRNTVVAVIDTGIATNHPDLAPNIVHTACYTSAGSSVGPNTNGACNPYPSLSDHGTHVAGTIAAAFGGGRVVGVGPNLGLASYNVFENIPGCGLCGFSDSRWAAMIDAANRGYQVINMSLGAIGRIGGQGSQGVATFLAAEKRVARYVNQSGTTMVASAGNSDLNLNGTIVNIPGGIPGIINVGATGIQPAPRYPYPGASDIRAFYSNTGAALTLAAPGGDCGQTDRCDPATRPTNWFEHLVLSPIVDPNPTCAAAASCNISYGWKAGTSMASPHVAGVAALMKDENPNLSPQQIAAQLTLTAENLRNRQQFGHGMVNAQGALKK